MACTATKAVKTAAAEIGTVEKPANSNKVKYNTWYYGKAVSGAAYPWCAVFVAWVQKQAGGYDYLNGLSNKAYCPDYVNWAKQKGYWLGRTKDPKAGDLVLFHTGNNLACHIGIVEKKINNTTVQTIEGNTSFQSGSGYSESNGGAVARRTRYYNTSGFKILGFIRLPYKKAAESTASQKEDTSKETAETSSTVSVTAKSGLNVRKSASTSSAVLGALKYGTKVKLLKKKSGWGQIDYNGKKGWIYLTYTK